MVKRRVSTWPFDKFYQINVKNNLEAVWNLLCKQIIEHHKEFWKDMVRHLFTIIYNWKKIAMKKILIVDDEPNIVMSGMHFKEIISKFFT
jgi:hypothetical protein